MPTPGLYGASVGPSSYLLVRQYVELSPSCVLATSSGAWAEPSATYSSASRIVRGLTGLASPLFLSFPSVFWVVSASPDDLPSWSMRASASCQLPRPSAAMRSADTAHL